MPVVQQPIEATINTVKFCRMCTKRLSIIPLKELLLPTLPPQTTVPIVTIRTLRVKQNHSTMQRRQNHPFGDNKIFHNIPRQNPLARQQRPFPALSFFSNKPVE